MKGLASDEKDAVPPKATKDKSSKARRPQPLIKLVMRRSLFSFTFQYACIHALCTQPKKMSTHLYYTYIVSLASALSIISVFARALSSTWCFCPLFTGWKVLSEVSLDLYYMQQHGLFRRWEKVVRLHSHLVYRTLMKELKLILFQKTVTHTIQM